MVIITWIVLITITVFLVKVGRPLVSNVEENHLSFHTDINLSAQAAKLSFLCTFFQRISVLKAQIVDSQV